MTEKLTMLIADDHTLIREAWRFVLNSDPRFQVIAETSDGEKAVELARQMQPHIVLLDISLRNMSGIEAAALIRNHSPRSKILGVSMHTGPAYVRNMIQKGARGYITKNSGIDEMFKAIMEIHEGREYICEEIKNILSEIMISGKTNRKEINSLSQREIEIIGHIKNGQSSKEIASVLNISPRTIEVHRHNIMKKLQLKNVASLINYVNNNRLELDERFAIHTDHDQNLPGL